MTIDELNAAVEDLKKNTREIDKLNREVNASTKSTLEELLEINENRQAESVGNQARLDSLKAENRSLREALKSYDES